MRWLALLMLTGCAPAYLHAASSFSDEGRAQLRTLAPAETLSSDLCLTRARLDALHHRLAEKSWGAPPSWSLWMDQHPNADGKTWRQKCAEQAVADQVLHESTRVLDAYLTEMKGVADGQLPYGVSPTLLAQGVSGAVTELHAGMGSETAKALEGPLTDVMNVMLQKYDAHELRPFFREGEPRFQRLIAALARYIDSIDAERLEVEKMEADVIDQLEQPLAQPSPDEPMRTIAFVGFTQQVDAQLRANARAVQQYRDTLQALASTHTRLTHEALGDEALKN